MEARIESGGNVSENYCVGQNGSMLVFKQPDTLLGLTVTNATYAALSMLNGDAFAKKFGGETGNDPDYFLLTVYGYSGGNKKADSVNFYLADYRFADNSLDYIVKSFANVNTAVLGLIDSAEFTLTSSDVGQFGMNTPAFFCVDDVLAATALQNFESEILAPQSKKNKGNGVLKEQYTSGNAMFYSHYSVSIYGDYWSKGFAISNLTDSNTTDTVASNFYNYLYQSVVGKGAEQTTGYAIAQQNATIKLINQAVGKQVDGVYVTNSNYAYLSMKYGDAFARKFSDTDFFAVTFMGWYNGSKTDSVNFYLAKDGGILSNWAWVDLKKLNDVDSISLKLTSSDNGQFGMNTPAFVAIDEFTTRDVKASTNKHTLTQAQATVYPNPTNGVINISMPNGVKQTNWEVYNMVGQQVGSVQNNTFNFSQLPKGVYFLKATNAGIPAVKVVVE